MQQSQVTSEARKGIRHNIPPTQVTQQRETRGYKLGAMLAGLIRREVRQGGQAKTDEQTLARIGDVEPDYERAPKAKRSPVRRIVVKRLRD